MLVLSVTAGRSGETDNSGTGKIQSTLISGSSYVEMDSWVYPALDRLAALGFVPSQISGIRPWTRAECARQLKEADGKLAAMGTDQYGLASEASQLITALHGEFDEAPLGLVLDSAYTRTGIIAGPALSDSFHFGQTWSSSFGEPFNRGLNSYEGYSLRGEKGRFFGFMRGEFQHAPSTPAYSLGVRQTLSVLDIIPLQGGVGKPATNRFRVLDGYVGFRIKNIAISAGQQTLWWGPTYDNPLSFSDNAEPTKNVRISMEQPWRLPGVLKYLGEVRAEFVMGRLGGQQYTWRPWYNAQKVSFKITPDLEMGFTRWSIFWGVGHPETFGSLLDNFTSTTSQFGPSGVGRNDPGDRKAGFDLRFRVPGLRNWLTLYTDSYSDDDPSPLASPRRAGIMPGLYLARIPGIPKLDFRVEAPSTEPMEGDQGGQFIYYNYEYRSGNTNYGYLLGNTVGRDGRGIEGWSTYHFSARKTLQVGYREIKGGGKFLPGGAAQTDATVKGSLQLGRDCYANAFFQYERFWIPLLGAPQSNVSGWLEVTWEPKLRLLR